MSNSEGRILRRRTVIAGCVFLVLGFLVTVSSLVAFHNGSSITYREVRELVAGVGMALVGVALIVIGLMQGRK